jgi:hypothetical protein
VASVAGGEGEPNLPSGAAEFKCGGLCGHDGHGEKQNKTRTRHGHAYPEAGHSVNEDADAAETACAELTSGWLETGFPGCLGKGILENSGNFLIDLDGSRVKTLQ